MIKDELKKLWPAGLIVSGGLAWIAIPRDLMGIPDALGDWIRVIPFTREAIPQFIGLALVLYGCWRMFEIYVLPLFAHKVGPWRYDRISMLDFVSIAGARNGWNLNSLEILDLIDGIGQALADGAVHSQGRYNPQNYSNLTNIYLVPISPSHWRRNYIDVLSAVCAEDNVQALSRPRRNLQKLREYVDIHLNRVQARAWLLNEGAKWKGLRDRGEQPREASNPLSEILERACLQD